MDPKCECNEWKKENLVVSELEQICAQVNADTSNQVDASPLHPFVLHIHGHCHDYARFASRKTIV